MKKEFPFFFLEGMQYLCQPSHFWDLMLVVEIILESSSKPTGLVEQHCTTQWIIHSYLIQMTQQIIEEAKPAKGQEQEIIITPSFFKMIITEYCRKLEGLR